jgi:hypothetical protein
VSSGGAQAASGLSPAANASPAFAQVLQKASLAQDRPAAPSESKESSKTSAAPETAAATDGKTKPSAKSKSATKAAENYLPSPSSGKPDSATNGNSAAILADVLAMIMEQQPTMTAAPESVVAHLPQQEQKKSGDAATVAASTSVEISQPAVSGNETAAAGIQESMLASGSAGTVRASAGDAQIPAASPTWSPADAKKSTATKETKTPSASAPAVNATAVRDAFAVQDAVPAREVVAAAAKLDGFAVKAAAANETPASGAVSDPQPAGGVPQSAEASGAAAFAGAPENNAAGLAAVMEPLLRLAAQGNDASGAAPSSMMPPQVTVNALPKAPPETNGAAADKAGMKTVSAAPSSDSLAGARTQAEQPANFTTPVEKLAEAKPAGMKQGTGAGAQKQMSNDGATARHEATKDDPSAKQQDARPAALPALPAEAAPQPKPEMTAGTPAVGNAAGSVPPSSVPAHEQSAQAPVIAAHERPVPAAPLQTEELSKLNDAKLAERAGSAEMRVAFETEKLGVVELRARISGDQVGAAIVVERHDAHAILAAELPGLRQTLEDRQLRVEHMTLQQGSIGGGHGQGSSHAQPQGGERENARLAAAASAWMNAVGNGAGFGEWAGESAGLFDSRGRLSVRA